MRLDPWIGPAHSQEIGSSWWSPTARAGASANSMPLVVYVLGPEEWQAADVDRPYGLPQHMSSTELARCQLGRCPNGCSSGRICWADDCL